MSKILLRSQILDIISKLKVSKNYSDENIEQIVVALKGLGDVDFTAQTLLKEVCCKDFTFDCVLTVLARDVSSENCEKQIWELLNSKTVSDAKKLFLINVLRDMGKKVDYDKIESLICDPDAAVDIETEAFLKAAKINPEAQIDFLDFFFTVNDKDKGLLLDSIIEDFSGDELANVLTPVIYYDPKDPIVWAAVDALKQCKSYLAFEPLNWIINNVDDAKLKHHAKKILNELKMLGLRENFSKKKLFKENFENSAPLGFWVTPVDGAGNFSLIFARKKNDITGGGISTFFTVINVEYGSSACFGFDNISVSEFQKILKRFFENSYMIEIELEVGVKILENSIKNAYMSGNKVPYELLCWRTTTYDIETGDDNVEEEFKRNLKDTELNEKIFNAIQDDDCMHNWFLKTGDNAQFDALLPDIVETKTIKEIGGLIETALEDKEFCQILDKRLLYQAYFLSQLEDKKNISNALFSLIKPSPHKVKFLTLFLQKSIYEYFLSKREASKCAEEVKVSIFTKKATGAEQNVDAEFYLNLIEAGWVNV